MGGPRECSSLSAAIQTYMGGSHECSSLVVAALKDMDKHHAPKQLKLAAAAATADEILFLRSLGDNNANLRLLTGLNALLGRKQPLCWLLQLTQLLKKHHRSTRQLPPHWAQGFLERCSVFLQVILLVPYLPSSDRSSTSDFGPC